MGDNYFGRIRPGAGWVHPVLTPSPAPEPEVVEPAAEEPKAPETPPEPPAPVPPPEQPPIEP